MRSLILFCLLTFISLRSNSQSQAFTIDYSWGHFPKKILQDHNRNFIVAGNDYDEPSYLDHIFIEKLDIWGNLVWAKRIKKPDHNLRVFDILISKENKIYLLTTSYTADYDSSNTGIILLADSGTFEWNKEYSDLPLMRSWSLQFSGDHHLVLSGTDGYDIYGGNNESMFVLKTDLQGHIVFGKRIKFASTSYGYPVSVVADGSIFLSGTVSLGNFMAVVAIDSSGNLKWSKKYECAGKQLVPLVTIMDDGYLMGVGNVYHPNNNFYPFDPMIFRMDTLGNLHWIKKCEANWVVAEGFNIIKDQTGNYLVHLEKEGGVPNSGFVVMEIDTGAQIAWSEVYEPERMLAVHMALTRTLDGGLAGVSYQGENWNYHTLLKVNQFNEGCSSDNFPVNITDLSNQTYTETATIVDFNNEQTIYPTIHDYIVDRIVYCEIDSFVTVSSEIIADANSEVRIIPNLFTDMAKIIILKEYLAGEADMKNF